MRAATSSMFDPAPAELRRMNRAITWSVAVHVLVFALVLFTPRSWWRTETPPREVMRINLGGSPGPVTGGQTNIGGRTVEQVAPPPPRPQTERPTAPLPAAPASAAPPVRAPQRTPPPVSTAPPRPAQPTTTARPQADAPRTATRPPVTGSQIARGNTTVDTGASGQGAGLASGGRFAGGEASLADFCCPEYGALVLQAIDARWNKNVPDRGTTVIKFTIERDGTITGVTVEKSSGYSTLDRAARNAVLEARVPRLPDAYTRERLTIHLSFPYGQ